MNSFYKIRGFINRNNSFIIPDLYGVIRLISLLIPFLYIFASQNISNNHSEFILKLLSLGFISASILSNEFYKKFYDSLIKFSEDFNLELNIYLSILFLQIIITIPVLLYFFKTNNYGEVISFILFLLYEKTVDETQRLIVFIEDSPKLYTLIIFFKRFAFLILLSVLAVFNLNDLFFFSLFSIGLLVISLSNIIFLYSRVIEYYKRNFPNISINLKLQIFKNLKFKQIKSISFRIKPFILSQIYTFVNVGPLFYLLTIIPSKFFNENLVYYLYSQKFITIPFLFFITVNWSVIRPKLRTFEPFLKLFLDIRIYIMFIISFFFIFTTFSINIFNNNNLSEILLYSSLTVILSNSFLYLNEIIFWRTNLSIRTFFSVIFFMIWIFSFLFLKSPISIVSIYLLLKIIYYGVLIIKINNKKIKFI